MTDDTYLADEDRPRRSSRKGPVIAIVLIGLLAVFGAKAAANWVGGFTDGVPEEVQSPSVESGLEVDITIPAGSTARAIGALLAEAGIIGSSSQFETSVRLAGVSSQLKAGSYTLATGMADDDVITELVRGPVVETFWVTVPEGLRISEIIESLAGQTEYSVGDYEDVLTGEEVESSLLPEEPVGLEAWEGLLFPDTYEFPLEAGPRQILARMASTMESRAASIDWESRGLSPYEGIVAASLIESETRFDDERPLVSSVIRNRIEIGMPLQIDATILYALGVRGVGLTLQDLEADSPFNTYQVLGLPPTPIASPGFASLRAAAEPADVDYLYYVLTDSAGWHSFTASYDEFINLKNKAKADGVLP